MYLLQSYTIREMNSNNEVNDKFLCDNDLKTKDFLIIENKKLLEERDELYCKLLNFKKQLQSDIQLLKNIILEDNEDEDDDE